MPDITVNSLIALRSVVQKQTKEALYQAARRMKNVLRFKIDSEWYARSGYEESLDTTDSYKRTFQLQSAVTAKKSEKGIGAYIFIDPDKIKPVKNKQPLHSYMNYDGSTSWEGKKLTELVPEWIEHGNSLDWMPETKVHEKTEKDIIKKNIHTKEIIKAFKDIGIDAKKV